MAQPVRVCEGAAQATRVQPQTARAQLKPQGHSPSLQGHSPSHEGSARLSLQGSSPSHSFPCIAKIRLNVVVIVNLLLPLLATPPGRTLFAQGVHQPPLPSSGCLHSPTHHCRCSHRSHLCPCRCNNVKCLPLPMHALLSPHDGQDLLLGGGGR
jgi:hypothetical protein